LTADGLSRYGREPVRKEETVHPLVWLGIALLVLWGILWLGFKIVSGVIHLLVIVGVVFLAWGLAKRGARAVRNRL
jgi:hypothetical protein